jgi:hypothetical protein
MRRTFRERTRKRISLFRLQREDRAAVRRRGNGPEMEKWKLRCDPYLPERRKGFLSWQEQAWAPSPHGNGPHRTDRRDDAPVNDRRSGSAPNYRRRSPNCRSGTGSAKGRQSPNRAKAVIRPRMPQSRQAGYRGRKWRTRRRRICARQPSNACCFLQLYDRNDRPRGVPPIEVKLIGCEVIGKANNVAFRRQKKKIFIAPLAGRRDRPASWVAFMLNIKSKLEHATLHAV